MLSVLANAQGSDSNIIDWNLLHYSIDLTPDYNNKSINGTNTIRFKAIQAGKVIRINLIQPMKITAVTGKNEQLHYKRLSNQEYDIVLLDTINKDDTASITVHFEGTPKASLNPPFDGGGWIWSKDKLGRPWISIACEGPGAAIWLPCKNALYDEPDNGVTVKLTVPDTLIAVSNGRLIKRSQTSGNTISFTWNVVNPINHYNIAVYVGKYVTWHVDYNGLSGKLDTDYWVLDYNLGKAKLHFHQADTLLQCFEEWLGPFPFYQDGYKVVEAPMPGMEHQSAIAYGNGFTNGYLRGNLSGTKWGEFWDFILVHESGHEWFGNSLTGESWIHEGFTKYLETIYTGHICGIEAGNDYALGINKRIKNNKPVIEGGTSDYYNKGSAMLHMIRQITGDTTFKKMLRALNKTFYHSIVNTGQILQVMNNIADCDLTKIFDQYLTTIDIPVLEYAIKNKTLRYRWTGCVNGFNMPLKISIGNRKVNFIYPEIKWKTLKITGDNADLAVDRNFYINVRRVN
jgi:aminopeptidase N